MNSGIESLLWYGLIALAFFFMMRGGCGAHVMGHGHRHHGEEPHSPSGSGGSALLPSGKAIDPVCGTEVDPASARSCVYRGTPYFFCSPEHRETFESHPDRYMRGSVPTSFRESQSHD
ncbi:MAG TPA: YHS domain-containing protein [Acetobacteraceae bacterium]|nr:YHS domain-containing protein [Acetobacteraceae bacterium]